MTKKVNAKRKHKRRGIVWIIILSFLFLIGIYYFKLVCPLVIDLSGERARSISTGIISDVVGDVMGMGVSYDDLVEISYATDGIQSIEVDTVKVNEIVRMITKGVQDRVDGLKDEKIGIALGTFTGIPFLYGRGCEIGIKMLPMGSVTSNISSSLISQGINQTLHRLYFTISIRLALVLPAKTQEFVTTQEILVCESVIVGKVPSVYMGEGLI